MTPACPGPILAALLGFLLAAGSPASAQTPDPFASHFGGSRTFEHDDLWTLSVNLLLLTQYGSRWEPGTEVYYEYDDLKTTVGYNYFHLGVQRSLLAPGGYWVASLTGSLGLTFDWLTRGGQDGLHDFLRFPHVQRVDVDHGTGLYGVGGEVSYWWTPSSACVRFDLHPHLTGTWSSFHREAAVGAVVGAEAWVLRAQLSLWKGWLRGRAGIQPTAVGARLEDDYVRWGGSLELRRDALGPAAVTLVPVAGVAVHRSTGIFPDNAETLLSVFVDFPVSTLSSVRLEFVNDLLADKDRGPTGGLRITYVRR